MLDIAYRINKDEIWAVDGDHVWIIRHNDGCSVEEFKQTYTTRFPDDKIVAVAFNPVRHVPIVLTSGVYDDADNSIIVHPTLYRFIIYNQTEVLQGYTTIEDGVPQGGTIQCIRRVYSPAPTTSASPTMVSVTLFRSMSCIWLVTANLTSSSILFVSFSRPPQCLNV